MKLHEIIGEAGVRLDLHESFDSPYPVECVTKTDQREEWKFNTETGEHYRINFKMRTFVGQKVAWLDFATYEGITSVTGTGGSFRVFATVIAVLRDFIKRYSPAIFSFSGKGASRKKLYDVFAKKISAVLPGYHFERAEEEFKTTEYIFSKNKIEKK